jgi:hypothetical protein
MNRNSNISKGSSAYEIGRHPALRWRTIFIALILALILIGANQQPLAQAASNNQANVEFELKAYPEAPRPLCPKEHLKIYVGVSRSIHRTINGTDRLLFDGPVSGVVVRGSVTDSHIGTLTSPESNDMTLAASGTDLRIGDADFLFVAKKAGTTILKFDGEVGSYWVGTGATETLPNSYTVHVEVPVTVRPCKFKVITASHWSASVPNLTSNLVANLQDVMEVNANGQYAGTAEVTWSAASYSYMCSHEHTIPPGQAHLTGDLNDSGVLRVNVTYDPVTMASVNCGGAESDTLQIQGPPIEIAINASGGTLTQAQTLQVGIMAFSGSTAIVVIPVEGEAVAFNTDSRAALSPSAWRARLWDNFPWLYNALLALR